VKAVRALLIQNPGGGSVLKCGIAILFEIDQRVGRSAAVAVVAGSRAVQRAGDWCVEWQVGQGRAGCVRHFYFFKRFFCRCLGLFVSLSSWGVSRCGLVR